MKIHTVHLVQDEDRTKKACDGETYLPPNPNVGDTLVLCKTCAWPSQYPLRKPNSA